MSGQSFNSAPRYSVYNQVYSFKKFSTIYGLLPYTSIKLYDHFVYASVCST